MYLPPPSPILYHSVRERDRETERQRDRKFDLGVIMETLAHSTFLFLPLPILPSLGTTLQGVVIETYTTLACYVQKGRSHPKRSKYSSHATRVRLLTGTANCEISG